MYFEHKRRLLAGILLSAALLSGCTSKPPAPEGSGSAGAYVSAPVGSGSASVPPPPDGGSSASGSGTADGSQDLEASGSGEAAAYDFSQRRVSLVRAMSIRPKYLVLDEVLSGLDLISADAVMRVLEQYHREFDCAFLLITHDMDSAYRLSDTILTMQAGQIVRVGIKQ